MSDLSLGDRADLDRPRRQRGLVPELLTPHPLGPTLPALFQEDSFSWRLCEGLDEVLTPIMVDLDCLDAYLDPGLAPPDFLEWLAGWVGLSLDQNWSDAQRRALVGEAGELYRWQGTARGIAEHIRLYTGVDPEVDDTGGVSWSAAPLGALPGQPGAQVVVRVAVVDPGEVDVSHLDAIVAAAKPAHVAHRVEVIAVGAVVP